jgi:DNA-binding SARP family transcriptional activator
MALATILQKDCARMADRSTRTPAPLRIAICGRLWAEAEELRLLERDFPARQGRRLWCYLVLEHRRTVGRDELADALWGDDGPDAWDTALNAVVSRIRSTIRPIEKSTGLELLSNPGGYQLQIPPGAIVDFERARFGLHLAETALAQGEIRDSLSEARVAVEIAARGFLPGDGLPWIELRRRQLRDIRIHAAECIAQGELRRGEPLRAEREAEQLLLVDPLNELGYRVLMIAAASLGNRAGIVRAMANCRQTLQQIAGMAPSAETERLYRELASGEPLSPSSS